MSRNIVFVLRTSTVNLIDSGYMIAQNELHDSVFISPDIEYIVTYTFSRLSKIFKSGRSLKIYSFKQSLNWLWELCRPCHPIAVKIQVLLSRI